MQLYQDCDLLAIDKNPYQFINRKDFMKKWNDRFGSFWDYHEKEFPAQPYNPDRV